MKTLTLLLPALLFVATPCLADHHRGWSAKSYAEMLVRKYDDNDDGKLNVDEYPERYRKYFGKTDGNSDGYVEVGELNTVFEEMQNAWRKRMKSRSADYRAKRAAQQINRLFKGDANDDGKLNADERVAIDKPFGEVDTNKDGYLSRAEVATAYGIALASEKPDKATPKNIVETAAAADSFNTLIKAAQAAGLGDALQGDGPFTVFAPTDEAFAKLPAETLAELLEDKKTLASILKYHVVAGKVLAKDVVKLSEAETLQGDSVSIQVSDSGVKVDSANVVKTDIICSNGVIHVIDAVILPELEARSADDGRVLFSFDNDNADRFYTVNDNVMGGVSKGSIRLTDDNTLQFFGNLSLKNNGGFASFRSKRQQVDIGDGDTIVARVRGDGREYYLNLYVPTLRMAFSYRTPVQTKDGEWTEVRVPLSDFYATSFGRKVSSTLNPSKVNSVGFMLADKQAGSFELEVESIRVEKSE